jgi:methyltransferase family protein
VTSVRAHIKRLLPDDLRARIRRKQSRLRWIHKYRRLRSFGYPVRAQPLTALSFVLLDPEVETFTYEIENEPALAAFLARTLGADEDEVGAYIDEAKSDPELTTELTRRVRWRWDTKARLPLGRRLGWYAITRLTRPRTIVETGIQAGLGSLTILRALERNAEEGAPGDLISVDLLRSSGWLVPVKLRQFWTPVYGSTFDLLDRILEGRSVDVLIQDLGAGYEAEMNDYETVSRHAAERLVIVGTNAHLTKALRDFAAERSSDYEEWADLPHRHVFPGTMAGIVVLGRTEPPDRG